MKRVIVCDTCAAPGETPQGEAFARALQMQAPEGMTVETTACMNLCRQPLALALRGEGCDIYMFAGLDPARDLDDAVALMRLYAEAETGTITDARPAGRLRHCLVGRVPR